MTKKEENDIKKTLQKEIKEKVLHDVNKEIQSFIEDNLSQYKNEFKEDINLEIENEVLNVMKREEKRLIRSKNFSLFKKDIVIIGLFVLVCYFGYCLYDVKYFSFMKSDCEKNGTCAEIVENNNQDSVEEEKIIKDKEWYIENLGYLLKNANVYLNADQANAYYLYMDDHKISEIKSSYLLNLAYKHIPEKSIKVNSLNVTVNAEDMRNAYQELFGTLDNYKDANFSYDCLNFVYNQDKDKYIAENNKCATANKEILENITDMYAEGNELYILTTATIYDKNENSFYSFDNLYDPILMNVTNEDFDENAKKLNKYQYVYKKVDESYYLDSITKLK